MYLNDHARAMAPITERAIKSSPNFKREGK